MPTQPVGERVLCACLPASGSLGPEMSRLSGLEPGRLLEGPGPITIARRFGEPPGGASISPMIGAPASEPEKRSNYGDD